MTPKPLGVLFDAMHHGKYAFEEFLNLDVRENYEPVGSGHRTIYRPSKVLKAFQVFLVNVLFEHLPVNSRVSFAYRKGTSLREAIEPHIRSRIFYQTDFAKFFESIDSGLIRQTILGNAIPVSDVEAHLDRILALTTVEERLPIGFVTSPVISNACLKTFDDALEVACSIRAVVFSRYADDIILSAQRRDELEEAAALIPLLAREHIHPLLSINGAKSKLTQKGQRIRILGFDILPNGRVTVSREVRYRVESLIHTLISDRSRFQAMYGGEVAKGLQQLGGYVSHVHTADPLYLAKLRRKYGAAVIDSLLHRSLSDE